MTFDQINLEMNFETRDERAATGRDNAAAGNIGCMAQTATRVR